MTFFIWFTQNHFFLGFFVTGKSKLHNTSQSTSQLTFLQSTWKFMFVATLRKKPLEMKETTDRTITDMMFVIALIKVIVYLKVMCHFLNLVNFSVTKDTPLEFPDFH